MYKSQFFYDVLLLDRITCEFNGTVFRSRQGSLASPNYPASYPNNLDCVFEIDIGSGELLLHIELSTESLKDVLLVSC